MPTIAATAPDVPRSRCPARIDMFVAFKPGSVLLSDINSRNSTSVSQAFFATSALRRYATTPPPKLVAPICKNTPKISRMETRGGAETRGAGGATIVSLMALRRVAF